MSGGGLPAGPTVLALSDGEEGATRELLLGQAVVTPLGASALMGG